MGVHKREKKKATTSTKSGLAPTTDPNRPGNLKLKGENFFRDAAKVKRLNMYKEGRATRNARGDIVKAATFQSTEVPTARVQPDRRWFNSTRVISQDALIAFREAMKEKKDDPYQFILKKNKLPMSLLEENDANLIEDDEEDGEGKKRRRKHPTVKILETESFEHTFGPKAQRKKARLAVSSLEELAQETEDSLKKYEDKVGEDVDEGLEEGWSNLAKEAIFHKGQSKRIWNELYKVIDSSDVLIHVLDARDPLGTQCLSVQEYLKKEAPHKHLVYVLNKCDLVPNWVTVSFFYFFVSFYFIFLLLIFLNRPKVYVRDIFLQIFCR